jgi:hypothetical protein
MAKPNWHYYEAHITVEEPAQPDSIYEVLDFLGLKVVDLVNINIKGLLNEQGIITTMHSPNLQDLVDKTKLAVDTLKSYGYSVQRYKIESTVIDSKFDDSLKLL